VVLDRRQGNLGEGRETKGESLNCRRRRGTIFQKESSRTLKKKKGRNNERGICQSQSKSLALLNSPVSYRDEAKHEKRRCAEFQCFALPNLREGHRKIIGKGMRIPGGGRGGEAYINNTRRILKSLFLWTSRSTTKEKERGRLQATRKSVWEGESRGRKVNMKSRFDMKSNKIGRRSLLILAVRVKQVEERD